MPIYQYTCSKCNSHFELKQGFHDEPEAMCPKCQHKARRLFIPAPIIFKGSGFYVTDHKKANGASEPAVEKKSESKASGEETKTSDSKLLTSDS